MWQFNGKRTTKKRSVGQWVSLPLFFFAFLSLCVCLSLSLCVCVCVCHLRHNRRATRRFTAVAQQPSTAFSSSFFLLPSFLFSHPLPPLSLRSRSVLFPLFRLGTHLRPLRLLSSALAKRPGSSLVSSSWSAVAAVSWLSGRRLALMVDRAHTERREKRGKGKCTCGDRGEG